METLLLNHLTKGILFHIDSSIPKKIFFLAFIGETLKIACSTLNFSHFLAKIVNGFQKYCGKVEMYKNVIHICKKL